MSQVFRTIYFVTALLLCTAHTVIAADEELLVLPPHPGWGQWKAITEQRSADRIYIERIPESQTLNDLKDLVVEQFYRGLQEKISPLEFLRVLPRFAQSTNCEKVIASSPVGSIEDGVKVAYAQMYCQKQKGKPYGFITLQKAIQGSNGIYIVQREWRVNAFEFETTPENKISFVPQKAFGSVENVNAWYESMKVSNQYLLNSVYLCGNGEGKRSCR